MFLLHLTGWISVVLNFPLLVAIKVPIMRYYPPLRRGETQWLILLCKSEAGLALGGREEEVSGVIRSDDHHYLGVCWLPGYLWRVETLSHHREREREMSVPCRLEPGSSQWTGVPRSVVRQQASRQHRPVSTATTTTSTATTTTMITRDYRGGLWWLSPSDIQTYQHCDHAQNETILYQHHRNLPGQPAGCWWWVVH